MVEDGGGRGRTGEDRPRSYGSPDFSNVEDLFQALSPALPCKAVLRGLETRSGRIVAGGTEMTELPAILLVFALMFWFGRVYETFRAFMKGGMLMRLPFEFTEDDLEALVWGSSRDDRGALRSVVEVFCEKAVSQALSAAGQLTTL